MMRWMVAGILGLVLIGTVFVSLGTTPRTGSCTEMGCTGEVKITIAESVPNATVLGNTYLAVDGLVLVDRCQYVSRARQVPNERRQYRIAPSYLNHTSDHGTIEELELGYRPSCTAEPNITTRMTDIDVGYEKFRPNGPGCPPTCIRGELIVD